MDFWCKGKTGGLCVAVIVAILAIGPRQNAWAQSATDGQGPTVTLLGQITAFDNGALTLKSNNGEIAHIGIGQKVRIATLTRAKFSDVKKGDFIASAGRRQKDGTLRAIEVRIFPAGGGHPREVHRKFSLGPDSTMTNATVDAFIGDISGRTFKVKYKGGEQTITVPKEAPVMRQGQGDLKLLKPGTNVSVFARLAKDGKMNALRIKVGMNGLMPPG